MGNVFLKLNQAAEAIDCFKAAIKLDSKYEWAYFGWGNALGKLEQTGTSLDPYLPTDEETPEYADLYNGWGVSLYQRNQFSEAQTLNQYTEAIEYFRTAIKLDSKYEKAYTGWGSALGKLEQTDTPLAPYRPTDKETPEYADLYNGWGDALYTLNQFAEAQTKYRKTIQLNGTKAIFQVNLGKVFLKR